MAFRATRQRKSFVSPTGMPDLSGYRQAAKSFTDVAEAAYSIGSDIRQGEFNDAIIQAELDGKTAGATYDKDGNLVPLTNLDYGKAGEIFGFGSQKAIEDTYRSSALTSYAQSIGVAANAAANTAFQINPDDPEAVRNSMTGFIDGLNLPDDIKSAVMPRIVNEFTVAESQSRAGQIKKARDVAIKTSLSDIEILSGKLGVLTANGQNEELLEGNQRMTQELMTAIEGNFDVLRQNGYSDTQINNLRDGIETKVAMRVNMSHIERVFNAKGEAEAKAEILRVREAFRDDPTVDEEEVGNLMESHLNDLISLKSSEKSALRESQINARNSYVFDLLNTNGQAYSMSDILAFNDISEDDRIYLINIREGRIGYGINQSKAQADREQSINNERFDALLLNYELVESDIITDDSQQINQMYIDGKISTKQYRSFFEVQSKRSIQYIKEQGDIAFANVEIAMMNFAVSPQDLVTIGERFIEDKLIGQGPTAKMKADDWAMKIGQYQKDFIQHQTKINELHHIAGRANRGIPITATESLKLEENQAMTVNVNDEEGNTVTVKADVFSTNPAVRNASLAAAITWFKKTGHVHSSIATALKNPQHIKDDIAFDAVVSFYHSFIDNAVGADVQNGRIFAENAMMKAGVNTAFFETARLLGPGVRDQYLALGDKSSADRTLRSFYGTQDQEEYFTAQFLKHAKPETDLLNWNFLLGGVVAGTKAVKEGQGYEKFEPYNILYRRFASESGLNVSEAILADPRMKKLILDRVNYYIMTDQVIAGEEGYASAIHMSMVDIMDDVGLQENAEGEIEWVVHPILKEAISTVGDRGVVIDYDDVKSDVHSVVSSMPSLQDPDTAEAIRERNFVFDANVAFGERPTYRVSVIVNGRKVPILANYRYDFRYSIHNDDYNETLENIQNDTLSKIWRSLPGFDPWVLRNRFSTIKDYNDSEEVLAPLIRLYNETFTGFDSIPLDQIQIEKSDLGYFVDRMISLGLG